MDAKRPDEPDNPAYAEPVSAKAQFDALISSCERLRGNPSFKIDHVLVAVVVLVLFALAVVYASFWRATPGP